MASQPIDSDQPTGGRREANKRDKLRRIRAAAREVFVSEGFEGANLRDIAAQADVAFGTLFLYAKNKNDLLLLVFDEELPEVMDRAYARSTAADGFLDQLLAFFAELYEYFCQTPELSRVMMRETTFRAGIVSERVWAGTLRAEQQVARIVAAAQADGTVSSAIAPDFAAHVLFSLYRIEIRFCLDVDDPDIPHSLQTLREQFGLVISGLAPRA
ncbi:MAG: TetR/AcrR family transcriptional regulator [Actinobacteria bacterium]|nr:TetR/AcrR family transcriptional regulator [Actinomycetota bacterium]